MLLTTYMPNYAFLMLLKPFVSWRGNCTCKCRLDASVSNDKQRWNNNECDVNVKKWVAKGKCDDGFL